MKRTSIILSLAFAISYANAQTPAPTPTVIKTSTVASLPSLDLYGSIPVKDCGWGFGFNLLSKPLNIGYVSVTKPLQIRLGGEFYFDELDHKFIGSVPLSAPQTGNAKVRLSTNTLGLNAMARFSMPYSEKITPYLDVFAGVRGFNASMNITPEIHREGDDYSTSQNLSSASHFNYGATFGVLISLNEWVKFNTGIMYTYSNKIGEISNIQKAYVESGNIMIDKVATRNGVWIAKVGFTFMLDFNDKDSDKRRSSSGSRSYGGSGVKTSGSSSSGGGRSNHVNIGTSRPSK